jgi:hypothetical protein
MPPGALVGVLHEVVEEGAAALVLVHASQIEEERAVEAELAERGRAGRRGDRFQPHTHDR